MFEKIQKQVKRGQIHRTLYYNHSLTFETWRIDDCSACKLIETLKNNRLI